MTLSSHAVRARVVVTSYEELRTGAASFLHHFLNHFVPRKASLFRQDPHVPLSSGGLDHVRRHGLPERLVLSEDCVEECRRGWCSDW